MNRRDAITAVGAVALGGAQQAFAQLGFSPRHVRFVRLAKASLGDSRGE